MSKQRISRRTLLRGALGGAAVAIALPPLEALLNGNGTGYAEGGDLPTRMGVWFWGNGVRRAHWIPAGGTGTGWVAPAELAALEAVRGYVSPVTGLEIKTATHPHHSGMAGIMTGAAYQQVGTTRDTIVSTFARQSVDQIAADHLGAATPFRSLEVGVTRFTGTDEGTTFQHLSHNGPNNVNAAEYSPAALFQRLFGTPPAPQVSSARRSILDAVGGQVSGLQSTVSAHDRVRLDQHLDSIRQIERRLEGSILSCTTPDPAADVPDVEGREQIEQKNRVMSDLMAMALACDMTRVFSVLFSPAGSGVVVWPAGANNGLHQMCHDEPGEQPTVHAAIAFTMEQLSYFLQRLRDTAEGDGNLLDRCAILCTTELSEGNRHSNDEFPILVAGKANGRLAGGVHYRSGSRENASHAPLTVLAAAGVPVTEFGVGAGRVTTTIGALEA